MANNHPEQNYLSCPNRLPPFDNWPSRTVGCRRRGAAARSRGKLYFKKPLHDVVVQIGVVNDCRRDGLVAEQPGFA